MAFWMMVEGIAVRRIQRCARGMLGRMRHEEFKRDLQLLKEMRDEERRVLARKAALAVICQRIGRGYLGRSRLRARLKLEREERELQIAEQERNAT